MYDKISEHAMQIKRIRHRCQKFHKRYQMCYKHVITSAVTIMFAFVLIMGMTGVLFNSYSAAALGGGMLIILPDGSIANSNDVSEQTRTLTEYLPYETVYEYSNLIAIGDEVVTGGEYGEISLTLHETLVNGEVVFSEVLSRTESQPVTQVVTSGLALQTPHSQKDFPQIRLENGRPVDYVAKHTGGSTAYTARETARTASGIPLEIGTVAVNPLIIPYGSLVYIITTCGNYVYGAAIAADTGPFVHWQNPAIVDVFIGFTSLETRAHAFRWGRRNVDLYVIEFPDDN
ncbi:MAG: 3D domain-containing protein [Oscillospiraceae bacterium]|nr:3D domain-containing protein [Oscillospiraceae bacterium]